MGLTAKQAAFVAGVVSGKSLTAAYRDAYDCKRMSARNITVQASRLRYHHPKVTPAIEQGLAKVRDTAKKKALWSREIAIERLSAVNGMALAELEKNGLKTPSAVNGFMDTAKELNRMTKADQEPQELERGFDPLAVLNMISANFHGLFCKVMSDSGISDFWLAGGRGSTKSSFISLCIVELVQRYPFANAVVIRRQGNTLRDSVYAQMLWAISALGLSDEFTATVSPMAITRKATGQTVKFFGMDDPEKLKGLKVKSGYIAIVWIEELDQVQGWTSVRSIRQSLRRGGGRYWWFYSYNPPRSRNSWVNERKKLVSALDGFEVNESSYLDVLASGKAEWLGDAFIDDAEQLKREDKQAYRHEYLGEPVGLGSEVFDRVEFRTIADDEIAAFDNPRAGQDFGWYPDPWAFTLSEWKPNKRELLTYCEEGGQKVMPEEQTRLILAALHDHRCDGEPVYSDDAAPREIETLRGLGVNARAAGKGQMRDASYRYLQRAHWVIDPKRCPKLAAEVRAMEYEVTKDGEVVNHIPDGNDHYVDATRYAIMRDARRARVTYQQQKGINNEN